MQERRTGAFLTSLSVGALLVIAGCSPLSPDDEPLSGYWVAQGLSHTPPSFWLNLLQTGDSIVGTACATELGGLGNVTLYRDAPVRGEYPQVHFTVGLDATDVCCSQLAGFAFKGKIDNTRDVVGSTNRGYDLRFRRSTSPPPC